VNVPFVDLRAQQDEIRSEPEAAFARALDQSVFIGGQPSGRSSGRSPRGCATDPP